MPGYCCKCGQFNSDLNVYAKICQTCYSAWIAVQAEINRIRNSQEAEYVYPL